MTTDFFDHDWGMDYDAQTYARIEQVRYAGLWLEAQWPANEKTLSGNPSKDV